MPWPKGRARRHKHCACVTSGAIPSQQQVAAVKRSAAYIQDLYASAIAREHCFVAIHKHVYDGGNLIPPLAWRYRCVKGGCSYLIDCFSPPTVFLRDRVIAAKRFLEEFQNGTTDMRPSNPDRRSAPSLREGYARS